MNNYKNQTGAIPIIAVIILVIAIGGAAYVGQKKFAQIPNTPSIEKLKSTPESTLDPKTTLEINFSEAGNILNWDSQTESYTDEWTLLYEKPSNPAIAVKLKFDENSICNTGAGDELCDKNKLNNGDMAQVKGNRIDDTVIVIKLEKLDDPYL